MPRTSLVLHSLILSSLIRHHRSLGVFFLLNLLISIIDAFLLGAALLRFDGDSSEGIRLGSPASSETGRGRGADVGGDLGRVTPEVEPDDGRVDGEEIDIEDIDGDLVAVDVESRKAVGEFKSRLQTASDGLGDVAEILGLGMVERLGVGSVDNSGVPEVL